MTSKRMTKKDVSALVTKIVDVIETMPSGDARDQLCNIAAEFDYLLHNE